MPRDRPTRSRSRRKRTAVTIELAAMRRRVAVGLGMSLIVVSCSGGDRRDPAATKAAMCAASSKLDAASLERTRLWVGKSVAQADVARTLEALLVAAQELEDNVTDELSSLSGKYLDEVKSANGRLLSDWGSDGTELFARFDRDDVVPRAEYQTPSGRALAERVHLACFAPPSGWVAVEPRQPTRVPVVDMLAIRRVDGRFRLLSLDAQGETLLPAPDGLDLTAPTVSADGSTLAVTGYDNDRRVVLVGSSTGRDLTPSSPAAERWMCPTFVDAGRSLLVTRRTGSAAWSLGKLNRESGGVSPVSPSAPLRDVLCGGVEVGSVLVTVGTGDDGEFVLVRVVDDKTPPMPFARLDGCNVAFPQRRVGVERALCHCRVHGPISRRAVVGGG
jgi:hypothetical protein